MKGRTFGVAPCSRPRFFTVLLGALTGLLVVLMAPAAAFAIDEFPVPTPSSQPGGITLGPDGAIWFTEENGHKIGRITTSGSLQEFPIPFNTGNPPGPSEIATGPDGALWFTEFGANPPMIGRMTTAGVVTNEYPVPGVGSSPDGIVAGPDGALWFTEYGSGEIGRITTGGAVTEYPLPNGNTSHPGDIVVGPDNRLWFTESTPTDKIGAITSTGAIQEFDRPGSDPSGIASSGASLWVTQFGGNKVEQISTTGATLNAFPTGAEPSGITFGPDNALWFTETAANKIGRLTTSGSFTEFPVPTTLSAPGDIVGGPDGALWFTEFDGNKIGRIAAGAGGFVPPPPPPPPVGQSGKPSVQSLSFSPSAFRAAKAGASISAKVGTKVTYRLSMAASTRFTVERESVGRKKGKKCVKQTRRNRKAKRCKLYKVVRGSFTHRGKAGSNSFKFSGRLGGKSLKPGRYRLVAVATVGSSKSTLKRASFRIVRR